MRTAKIISACCLVAVTAGCFPFHRNVPGGSAAINFEELLISGGKGSREAELIPDFFTSGWDAPANELRDDIDGFAQGYLDFLYEVRTGYELHRAVRQFAADNGFEPAELYDTAGVLPDPGTALLLEDAGGNNIALVRVGRRPLAEGCRIFVVSTDLTAMEIKPHALFGQHGFVLMQTAYAGYVRKHQWLSVPLGLVGQVFRGDGAPVDVEMGMDGEGVLVIPDLLPHLAYDEQQHRLIPAEGLDVLAALQPGADDTVPAVFIDSLRSAAGVDAGDFVGARIELVPVGVPVEAGVDRGMIGAYGQSAKLPVYLGLRALAEQQDPEYTVIVLAARGMDEYEEFGMYPPVIRDLAVRLSGKTDGPDAIDAVLHNAVAMAGGTMPAVNPLYKDGWAEPAYGPVLILDDDNDGAARRLVRLFTGSGQLWQKVGTRYRHRYPALAVRRDGVPCVNMLCPLLAEGAFCELASKMDLFLTYGAVRAFFSATDL